MAGPKRFEVTFNHVSGIPQMLTRTASSEDVAVRDAQDGYQRLFRIDAPEPVRVQEHELGCVRGHPEEEHCRDRYGDSILPEKENVS